MNHETHGIDFLHVEAPKLAPPWPNYDKTFARNRKTTARVIADTVEESGYDVAAVIAYEEANANRPDVLAELRKLLPEEAEDVVAA